MLSKKRTSCQFCAFSVCDKNTITQTGCRFELLDKYQKDKEAEIFDCYNEFGEFYVINNRMCFFKRNKEWLEKHKDKDTEQLFQILKKENQIKYQSIIVTNNSFDDLLCTFQSIKKQSIKPSHITILNRWGTKIEPEKIRRLFRTEKEIKWRISYLCEGEELEKNIRYVIGLFCKKYPIYQILECPMTPDSTLMENLNSRIVEDGYNLTSIIDDKIAIGNGIIHKILRGDFSECQVTMKEFLNFQ